METFWFRGFIFFCPLLGNLFPVKGMTRENHVDPLDSRIHQLEAIVLDLKNKEQNHLSQMQTILSKLTSTSDELASVRLELATLKDNSKILIAFQVKKNTSDDNVPHVTNHVLKFDNLIQNLGHGYDISTGVFTAPASGFYRFWAIVNPISPRTSPLSLMRNGKRVISSTDYDHGQSISKGFTYYMLVNKRDTIWFQMDESVGISSESYLEGVLIRA